MFIEQSTPNVSHDPERVEQTIFVQAAFGMTRTHEPTANDLCIEFCYTKPKKRNRNTVKVEFTTCHFQRAIAHKIFTQPGIRFVN